MRYASVCDGIGAVHEAWQPLGWTCAWTSEIEPFPIAVVEHRWGFDNLSDMTKISETDLEKRGAIDLLVGGTPCQSFSIAGLRGGLADRRGNLTLTFVQLVDRIKPRYVVWENVPGILSDSTQALHSFLDGLEAAGYAIVGLDILDAQYFGVAQRRRRVFVCAQNIEDLLTQRTQFSGVIAAQCLAEMWRSALGVLCARFNPGAESSASESSKYTHSLRKRIELFGLQRGEQALRLLDCLGVLRQSSGCGQENSDSANGKASSPTPASTEDTKSGASEKRGNDTSESPSIAPSWRTILAEGLLVANECITSTSTSGTIESRIYICAKAMLSTAKFMLPSLGSLPGYSVAAASCLTALWEFIDYARFASLDLFGELGRDGGWGDFLREAEQTSDALGNIRVECFGEILPLSDSLSGNPPPIREAGKGVTGTIASRPTGGGGLGTDFDLDGGLVATGGRISHCLNAGGMGRQDFETKTLIPVTGGFFDAPTHSLRADGFDASEDGTGRGTPLVPVVGTLCSSGRVAGSATQQDAESGMLVPVAFSCKDHGADAGAISPTLRSMGHDGSHANGGGQIAIAYAIQERALSENVANGPEGKGFQEETAYTLEARNKVQMVAYCGVRRLTPLECERLQGFRDYYTLVPYCGKTAADGPRYKSLGNSMAVPVITWIGRRLETVDRLTSPVEASPPQPIGMEKQ